MFDYVGALKEFHIAFGHHTGTVPTAWNLEGIRDLRIRLMEEELSELEEALDKKDLVGIADGLADLLYVVFGTALAYGIPIDEVFSIVHKANMAKMGPDGKPMRDAGGKTIKPPGWKSPNEEIGRLLSIGNSVE